MSTTFRPYNPNQTLLFPPSLREWLPEGHLSHFISETIYPLAYEKKEDSDYYLAHLKKSLDTPGQTFYFSRFGHHILAFCRSEATSTPNTVYMGSLNAQPLLQ